MKCRITIDTNKIEEDLFNFEKLISFESISDHLLNFFFDNLHRIISINFGVASIANGSVEFIGRAYFTVSLESCITALRAGKSDFLSHIESL
ncbi:TPA: hypothetical protein QBZ91_002193 [Pasteurella multocida]|uniref:hypothetical protein n=1 Tax=Pasteurella multocida TaxID=747 RepID=UPI000ABD4747|nr:hypothetical protein [Pasteurella multocida]HDR0725644.1 hypothetical protein [Pasteurella multocida]HDR0728138.1 hypothetical protein [Pasteurella multocida]